MKATRQFLARLREAHGGSTIVEFALVLPVFIMMLVGGFYLAMIALTAASVQYAAQDAARCASINTGVCTNTTTTATYATKHFIGVGTPSFTVSTASCGNRVNGSVNYVLNTGLRKITVPLSATACYP